MPFGAVLHFIRTILLVLLFGVARAEAGEARIRVWIDTDAACDGTFATDVDDCWALAYLLNAPNIEVAGISTVFGNRDTAPTRRDIAEILQEVAPDKNQAAAIPVAEGANGPGSSATPAVRALVDALEHGPLTILALGPVTNIAALARQRQDLGSRIDAIVAVAGQRPGEWFFPGRNRIFHVHDMNFAKDVGAFETLLGFGAPLALVPYDAGRQVTIDAKDLAGLRKVNGPAGWLADISAPWLAFWKDYFSARGFYPFDLVAAAYVAAPGSLVCRRLKIQIVHRYGLFRTRDTLEIAERGGRTVTYCDGVDGALKARLVSAFR